MVCYIVVSQNSSTGETYVQNQCIELSISSFDQLVIGRETDEKATASIGIDAIKKAKRKIYLKPSQGPIKAVICLEGELLTTEAQSSLLKVLEEPPANTYIYILTKNLEAILDTVRSRCSIIDLNNVQREIPHTNTQKILASFTALSLSEKLALAEKHGKNKNLAQQYLEELLKDLHNQLHSQKDSMRVIKNVNLVQQILLEIQTTNVNPRLAVEKVILGL